MQVEIVLGLDELPNLQRVFLSVNNISRLEDIKCIFNMVNLSEFSLDGNPISNDTFYRQHILARSPNLRHFDLKRVTPEERNSALAIIENEREQQEPQDHLQSTQSRPPSQLQLTTSDNGVEQEREPGQHHGESFHEEPRSQQKRDEDQTRDRERESAIQLIKESWYKLVKHKDRKGSDNARSMIGRSPMEILSNHAFIEVNGKNLDIYGNAVFQEEELLSNVDSIDSISIRYVNHATIKNSYIPELLKLGGLRSLSLYHNDINSLEQLKIFGQLTKLDSVNIHDNPICELKLLWRPFLIIALPKLRYINGESVTSNHRKQADRLFGMTCSFFSIRSIQSTDIHSNSCACK